MDRAGTEMNAALAETKAAEDTARLQDAVTARYGRRTSITRRLERKAPRRAFWRRRRYPMILSRCIQVGVRSLVDVVQGLSDSCEARLESVRARAASASKQG